MAMEWKMIILQLSLVVLLGQSAFAGSKKDVTLIDRKPIEEAAKIICGRHDGNSKLFIDMPTVTKLADYISHSSDKKMVDCWAKYGESISMASRLVTTSNDDTCSNEKISLIEEFHHKFISKRRRDVKEQEANQRALPSMLNVFFIHYAKHIGEICGIRVSKNLEKLSADDATVKDVVEGTNPTGFNSLLDNFSQSFDFRVSDKNQKYMFLFWNLIDDIAYESKAGSNELSKYVNLAGDLVPGNHYRVSVRMDDPTNFRSAQDICRNHLRPVYARTVLPVLRLVDLGYYYEYIGIIPDRWYKIAQLCEIILPIRFLADSSLAQSQLELVPKNVDPQLLDDSAVEPFPELAKIENNNLKDNHILALVVDASEETNQMLKDIKGRKDIVKRVISKMAPKFQALAQSRKSSFFLGSQKGVSAEKQDLTEAIGESLAEMSEPTSAEKNREKAVTLAKGLWSGLKQLSNQLRMMLVGAFAIVAGILMYLDHWNRIGYSITVQVEGNRNNPINWIKKAGEMIEAS